MNQLIRIVFFVVVSAAAAHAQDRLKPYIKAGFGTIRVTESNNTAKDYGLEDLGGNLVNRLSIQMDTSTKGSGRFFELGYGVNIDRVVAVEVSLLHAPEIDVDGELAEYGTYRTYDNLNVLQSSGTIAIADNFKADFRMTALMVDLSFDLIRSIDHGNRLSAMIKIGAGYAHHDLDDLLGTNWIVYGEARTSFAWRIGLGLGCQVNDNLMLRLDYAYTDFGEARTRKFYSRATYADYLEEPIVIDVKTHMVSLAAIYSF